MNQGLIIVFQTIFGTLALLGAAFAYCLPETKDHSLLSYFDEAEEGFQQHLQDSIVVKLFCLPKPKNRYLRFSIYKLVNDDFQHKVNLPFD